MHLPATLTASLPSPIRLGGLGLALLTLLLWGAPSAAAQQGGASIDRAPSAPKHAGVYHVSSGTWTRRADSFGPSSSDVIYSNTLESGYYSPFGGTGASAAGSEVFSDGGLPGTTNGHSFATQPDRDTYRVNGFQIGYCDLGAPMSSGWEISFYGSYAPCSAIPAPVTRIATTGLPAGGQCWVIDLDLTGGEEFDIGADGGDGWHDDPDLDSFGWSFRYVGSDPGGGAGFSLSGRPELTDLGWLPGARPVGGFGTYYGGQGLCAQGNTGYLVSETWWVEDPAGSFTGCYFFQGPFDSPSCGSDFDPIGAWHMEIYAESGTQPQIGVSYCASTANSTGAMTTLVASGSEVATDDAVELSASNMPASALGFFITSQTQGTLANPGGSAGILCVAGNVGRFMQPGQVKVSGADGTFTLSTTLGEWSTSDIPQATPPQFYAAMAGMTSSFQLWHRDAVMGSATSNFSNGLSITWQ